ncbi:MAG: hypothetical protein J5809_02415 [Selenomonadaceae bacterium]|nr:hypothetical protein [Selenomonadaceae bacterium]
MAMAVVAYMIFTNFIKPPEPEEPPEPPVKPVEVVAKTDLSLNGIDVGISLERLNEILGAADSVEDFDGYSIYRYGALKAEVRSGKIVALMTDNSKFSTSKNIHVGSTYSEVVSAYGQHASKSSERFTIYEYPIKALNDENGVLRFSVDGVHLSDPVVQISARLVARREANENVEQAKLALHRFLNTIARKDYNKAYDEMLTNNYKNLVPKPQFVGMCEQLTSVDFNENFTEVSSSANSVVLAFEAGSRTKVMRDGKEQTLYTPWTGEIEMVNEAGVWKINVVAPQRGEGIIEK